jgi:hypothetical protein
MRSCPPSIFFNQMRAHVSMKDHIERRGGRLLLQRQGQRAYLCFRARACGKGGVCKGGYGAGCCAQ